MSLFTLSCNLKNRRFADAPSQVMNSNLSFSLLVSRIR